MAHRIELAGRGGSRGTARRVTPHGATRTRFAARRSVGGGVRAAAAVAWLAVGVGGCPGGQGIWRAGNDSSLGGTCEGCPAGKQSPVGEALCVYCRETLQPNALQDGCECAPLHFSPWNATAQEADVGCTPCAGLKVHRLANMRKRSQSDDLLSASGDHSDSNAVPCKGPSLGVQKLVEDKGNVDAVKLLCGGYDDAECAGGPKGDAEVCPNAGVWILPHPFERIRQNSSAFPPARTSQQVNLFRLQECLPPRGGGASRCQHWSRCVQDADTTQDANDPWQPYVSDKEFAVWLSKGQNSGQNCRVALSNIKFSGEKPAPIDDFDDPWGRMHSDGLNCCAPNFYGYLCEHCLEPLMKINTHCVRCDGVGARSVNWSKLAFGVVLAVGFTFFIMHKATVTFKDADGTITVAIFFFQLVALLFKDRATKLAYPFMLDILAVLELSFIANSERTCVIKLDFYENYYFNIVSTIAVIFITYAVIVAITTLTSSLTHSHEADRLSIPRAKELKAAIHVLYHIHAFESLEPQCREDIAKAMVRCVADAFLYRKLVRSCCKSENLSGPYQKVRDGLTRGTEVMKEGATEKFFIVLKGKVDVEQGDKKLSTIRVGQHFGIEALFNKRAASCTIKSVVDDTSVMYLTRKKFRETTKRFPNQVRESIEYNLQHHHHEDEHGDIVQVTDEAGEDNEASEESSQSQSTQEVAPSAQEAEQLSEELLGTHEKRSQIQRTVEAQELAERVLTVQFKQARRKVDLTTEVEVHSCCAPFVKLLQPIGVELGRLYGAALDPTARATAILEAMIALYGPLTLHSMSVLFCRDVSRVTPDGIREVQTVLVVDSTKQCSGSEYESAKLFGICSLCVFCLGVPLVMLFAAKIFYMELTDSTLTRSEAKALAKTRFHSSWKAMGPRQRKELIEQCQHEIRQDLMGQSSFLLSTFQMCVERRHAYWYPQWHLIRRTFLNYLYFDGMRSGDNTTGVFVARYDWRVVVAIVLIVSNVLHQYTQPFRDVKEDRLETWSLNLLTLVVVIDIADEANSIYACLVVSIGFGMLVAKEMWVGLRQQSVANSQWHNLRKLQVQTGVISGDGVEKAANTSMLKIKLSETQKKERLDMLKATYKNPLSKDFDDSDEEDAVTKLTKLTGKIAIGRNGVHANLSKLSDSDNDDDNDIDLSPEAKDVQSTKAAGAAAIAGKAVATQDNAVD